MYNLYVHRSKHMCWNLDEHPVKIQHSIKIPTVTTLPNKISLTRHIAKVLIFTIRLEPRAYIIPFDDLYTFVSWCSSPTEY